MQPKNRITAAMLAFFTGFMGGHKIYLGQTGGFIGFMVLLMVSFNIGLPISLIAGVMNGIKLLNMSDQEFDKRYNRGIIQVRRGPLEARRDAQMMQYEQIPDSSKNGTTKKPSPVSNLRANPYKNSGIKKYKDFDLTEAIADFKKGLEISPGDVALHFNIACAYSLTENKALAYHHISKAVSLGLGDTQRILSHDDLAFVRIQPEFEAFKSGGFRVNPFPTAAPAKETVQNTPNAEKNNTAEASEMDDSLLAQLNKLSELRKRGILSEEEFVFERKKILRQ
ncbi:MAG: NINE protein [Saprospiraceae bacterium]|nr:NINE protein [Saprospiraceae bacterium]